MLITRYEEEVLRGCVRLSNRQYSALRIFTDNRSGYVLSSTNGRNYDQRSFGSLYTRGYVEFDAQRQGWKVTDLGKRAMATWEQTNIANERPAYRYAKVIRDDIRALSGEFKPEHHKEKKKLYAVA